MAAKSDQKVVWGHLKPRPRFALIRGIPLYHPGIPTVHSLKIIMPLGLRWRRADPCARPACGRVNEDLLPPSNTSYSLAMLLLTPHLAAAALSALLMAFTFDFRVD
jgi:hypothetical protein